MSVPLIDVVAEYRAVSEAIDAAVHEVLAGGRYILGPNVALLEREVADFLGAAHAVGVANGTDALYLSLLAHEVGPGDEVIVPAYSFYATVEAVQRAGATPVFADVRADTYCVDVDDAARRVTSQTKAILPVHLYGHPAAMPRITDLASAHGLLVVEDTAQAFGATIDGRRVGAIGDAGCHSFFPTKNLGGFGDGGMVVSSDADFVERVRLLRNHGSRTKHRPERAGVNSRLDELQAAALRVKLTHVEAWNTRRREVARRYDARLAPLGIGVPAQAPGCEHVYHLYVVEVEGRDAVQQVLNERGIASAVYYPAPLHLVEACREYGGAPGDHPVAESLPGRVLAIPMFSQITDEQATQVADALEAAVGSR